MAHIHADTSPYHRPLLATFAFDSIAVIASMTKMKATRFTRVAFTGLFGYESRRAMGKTFELDCSESVLSHQASEDAGEDDKDIFHCFA